MTAATKTTSAKATAKAEKTEPAKPQPKTLKEAAALGAVRLFRQRKNGTMRSLPYLAPGTEARKEAETVVKRRAAGETIGAIAEDLNASVATVRRMATNLELALAIEAGEYADKWKPGDKRVIVSVVQDKAA